MDEYSTEAEATRTRKRHEAKREFVEFVKLVFYFLILFVGLRWYVVEGYEVEGRSMEPTLHDGERILVFKLPHILSQFNVFSGFEPFQPKDIVVFDSPDDPDKRYVKRVVAKGPPKPPSDTVSAKVQDEFDTEETVRVRFDEGKVYVDNHLVYEGDYIVPEENLNLTSEYEHADEDLGPGEFYVMGDYRDDSRDSRMFGPIYNDKIIGKAVFRFWPLGKFGRIQ